MSSDLEELLDELIPVREMLLNGDLRPLYIAWLACEPFEGHEPPVPAGIGALPKALQLLANFYGITEDLLHVAATESESCEEPASRTLPVQSWLQKKTEKQRLQLLESLLTDDSGQVQADALQSIRKTVRISDWPTRQTSRTMEELFRLAEERSLVRERQENAAKEKQRKKRLAGMAAKPAATVAKVITLIKMRTTAKYHEAVALLCELRDALGPDTGPEFTSSVAADLRKAFPRTSGLVAELKKHGFLSK